MPLDPKLEQEAFEAIYSALQDTASKIVAIYKTQWDVRNDIAKILLTVSSAVLVVSVSLSSRVTTHKWILGVCWAAFLLAIVAAIITLWFSLGLFTLSAVIFASREELRKRVKNLDITKPDDESDAITDELVTDQLNYMGRLDRRAIKTLKVSLVMFLAGLVLTGIVGWMQLYRATAP